MRQVKFILPMISILTILLVVGCSKKPEFVSEGPIITANISPAGPDDYRNLISKYVTIFADGKLTLTYNANHKTNHSKAPILEKTLTEKELGEVKSLLMEKDFFKMKKDISESSEDGSRYQVTAYTKGRTKEVSGWNPTHGNFIEIIRYIFDLFDKEERKNWFEEVSAFVWEKEAHSIHDVEQYQEEGPFFTLSILKDISNEYYSQMYEEKISLDVDGDISVHAFKDDKEIKAISPLHQQISEDAVDHFKGILLENYWKLKNQQSNEDGGSPGKMTLYLADEFVTVRDTYSNQARYDDIAEELLSLLEGDELYKWEQDVFYYYNELYEDDITTYLENTDPIFLEDIPYIFVAPKAWKAMDLSKVANIALLQKNQTEDLAIGLEVNKENIITDPLVGEVGLIVMDKVENVNNLEDAAEILKAYDLDKLGPYSINDEDFSLDDEEHWGLWIQFDDGTVKEYKNSGQEGEVTVPEDFNSLAKELESFVQRKLKED